MLQTKIFLSDTGGDSSYFCNAADYFNAWVKDNPNVEIKDVKFQHTMTTDKYNDDSALQASSIFVLFELPDNLELLTRFKWDSIWNRASLFKDKLEDKHWVFDKRREDPHFPLVGEFPSADTSVLVKLEDGTYKLSKLVYSYTRGYYYFEGIQDEHFSWQYLPE